MANETLYNVNFCRICQTPSKGKSVLIDISEKSDEGRSYWDTLKYLFEDIVWVEDSLKSLACQACLKTINDVAAFKSLCLETNYQRLCLQLRLKNVKVVKLRKHLNGVGESKIKKDSVSEVDVPRDWEKVKIITKTKVLPNQVKVKVITKASIPEIYIPPNLARANIITTKDTLPEVDVPPDWEKIKIKEELVDIDETQYENENEIPFEQEMAPSHIKEESTEFKENVEVNDSVPEIAVLTPPKLVYKPNLESKVETIEKVSDEPPALVALSPWPEVWVKEEPIDVEDTNYVIDSCGEVSEEKVVASKILQETADLENVLPGNEKTAIKAKRKRKDNLSETVRQRNETCEVSFSEYNYLTPTQWYKCYICKKELDNLDSLDRHIFAHNGTRMHTCSVCGRMYVTRSDLLVHSKIHSDAQYECLICPNKRFKTLDSLRKHNIMLMHMVGHSKMKPFNQDKLQPKRKYRTKPKTTVETANTFIFEPLLQNIDYDLGKTENQNVAVKIEKNYKCTLCNVTFYKRRTFDIHRRRHRFKCSLCDQKFMKRFYIRVHLKVKHNMDVAENEAQRFYNEVKESGYTEKSVETKFLDQVES